MSLVNTDTGKQNWISTSKVTLENYRIVALKRKQRISGWKAELNQKPNQRKQWIQIFFKKKEFEPPDNKLWSSQIHVIQEHLVFSVFWWLSFFVFFSPLAVQKQCVYLWGNMFWWTENMPKKAKLPKPPIIAISKAFNYEGEVRNMYVCVCVCQGSVGGLKL